jgi:hypothetical protein
MAGEGLQDMREGTEQIVGSTRPLLGTAGTTACKQCYMQCATVDVIDSD